MNKEILEVSIEEIKPNKYQPRTEFSDDGLFELTQSIRENGLIQPIVVRRSKKGYEIVAGERRYRACQLAGLVSVPCVLMEVTDNESAKLALLENIQREDLTPIEEARAYKNILDNNDYTQEQLARQLGKSQSAIANKLRLLDLSPMIQKAILSKEITERHARALLTIEKEKRSRIFHHIVEKQMTVKETEEYIEKLKKRGKKENLVKKSKTKGFSRNQQIAVNTIRQACEMSWKMGIQFELEEVETETDRRLVIKFPKEV